jgi:hypothetical protein
MTQRLIADGLGRTMAAARMCAAFTVSYGEARTDDQRWAATGALDLEAGIARMRLAPVDRPRAVFREIFTVGADVHQRLTPESGTWSRVREGTPSEGNMTDNLLGIGLLVSAVRRWEAAGDVRLRDGSQARSYRGRLPWRLGDAYDRTLLETFWETLPFVIRRRRLLEAWIDDAGLLRGLAITTDGPGIRHERKWLTLEVWDLGRAAVEPPEDATVLTGNMLEQVRQRWHQIRSSA